MEPQIPEPEPVASAEAFYAEMPEAGAALRGWVATSVLSRWFAERRAPGQGGASD